MRASGTDRLLCPGAFVAGEAIETVPLNREETSRTVAPEPLQQHGDVNPGSMLASRMLTSFRMHLEAVFAHSAKQRDRL